jgi:hypothetical protein
MKVIENIKQTTAYANWIGNETERECSNLLMRIDCNMIPAPNHSEDTNTSLTHFFRSAIKYFDLITIKDREPSRKIIGENRNNIA